MKTLTIIDTFGFFFRLYYAMSGLKNKEGKPSGMVSGFANFIFNLKNEFESDYIVFALDSKGETFRAQIDPNYKANRSSPPEELKEQLPVCIEMIEKMGFCSFAKEGYEADDVIASFIKNNPNLKINIVTHDKDLYQLIDERVSIYSPAKKELYDKEACYAKFGVYPEQIRDFLAITGDTSDNIPGVKGIGEKGAKKLLNEFKNIEEIYENLWKIPNLRTKELLNSGKESAFLSKKLATLCDNLETPSLENAKFPSQNPLNKIPEILEKYSLNRLLSKLDNTQNSTKFEYKCLRQKSEIEELLVSIDSSTLVAFDTETTGLDTKNDKIVGFSFCFNENLSYYVPINHEYLGVPEQIDMEFAAWAIERIFLGFVIGHNLKFDFEIIYKNFGIKPPKKYADTMILSWLDNPELSASMDALAKRIFDYETIKFENLVKKGENFSSVPLEVASKYAAQDAWITLKFYRFFMQKLPENIIKIANDLEFGFIEILMQMEFNGIKLDTQKLRNLINQNDQILRDLTLEIYELSGEQFNINSPKQLASVLFERLNLPCKKRTKTGFSTDESVLSQIIDAHPVICKILNYREIYKLQTTYCEPLLNLASLDEQNRVYTSFLQTGTATGRLSSKNPNLQNIPTRSSSTMRDCFVANDGFSLVSLDYSQIELRLLAHFSGDTNMQKAFFEGRDIHTQTALQIFGDESKRSVAKSINFGLIYGMGANKLSEQINVSKKEASEYIKLYFEAFPSIKNFLENLKNEAKTNGFSQTLLGRRRYFDFANSTPMFIAASEREAVNTKFQGSAADIIKLAMSKIHSLCDENLKMLLQIHDELIFEIRDDLVERLVPNLQEIMQNSVKLNVPLVVNFGVAKSWGELK